MRLLALVALAATAAPFAPALAQTVPDSDYGVAPDRAPPPPPHMRQGPPPGATWQGWPQMQMRTPMPPMAQGPQQRQQTYVVRRMGMGPGMGQHHVQYRHIDRGGMVPQRWWGPRVQVRNWRMYGFPQPFAGGRWIRYYDDALLIDGYGRVYDSRPGWDWDRYGERWDYEDDGVPVYAEEGMADGYGYSERYEHREMVPGPQVRQRVYVQQAPMMPPPPPPPAYGYGYGYGYGGVVVTETTVTEAPVVEQRTFVTYETVRVRAKHHHRRVVRCVCRRAPPPSYGGERG